MDYSRTVPISNDPGTTPGTATATGPSSSSTPYVTVTDNGRAPTPRRLPELNSWGGFAVTTAVTAVIGLIEYAIVGSIGWLTGIFFVGASAFVALAIKPADLATAVISPPIAYFVAAIISAQPSIIGSTGNFWVLQATSLVTALAFNAPWVFAGTLVALGIVLFRRYAMGRK